ncbi:MAG TPA: TonB-dependent receptor [Pyrinomonadaceae bacterium]
MVKDPNGAVVPGATVTATNEQRSYTATTNDEGNYSFAALPPGRYTVTATGTGFGTVERTDVPVELGRTLQVNFDLNIVKVGETVTVSSANEPIVDVTTTQTATNITEEQIDVLPKGLNFSSVLEVAPGTRAESRTGGFQIDGASGSENVYIVDGVEVTSIVGGTLGGTSSESVKNIPLDFVKEVQVKSAGYEAEFGGATGGVINVVTKSGSNEFHGEGRLEIESDKLRGNDRPALRYDPLDLSSETAQFFENPYGKDRRRRLNPVGTLSGPIVKNKLWFFTSYAPQFFAIERNLDLLETPEAAIAAGRTRQNILNTRVIRYTEKNDYLIGRLDFSPMDKLSMNASFINSPSKTSGPSSLAGISLLGRETTNTSFFNGDYSNLGGYTPSWQAAFAATYTPVSNFVLSFRGGRTYLNDKGGGYGLPTNTPLLIINAGRACNPTVTIPAGLPCVAGTTSSGFASSVTSNTATIFDVTKRTNINIDATWIASILGQQHIIKGGYQTNRLFNDVNDETFSGGRFSFIFGGNVAGVRGAYGYYVYDEFARVGKVSSSNQGWFLQDSWQVHPRLTANIGFRIEKEFLPSFPIDEAINPGVGEILEKPISFGYGDKFAPRLGLAWDVFGDGKLKLSASYSVFYDTMKYELARGSFGGEIFIRERRRLETSDIFSINRGNLNGALINGPANLRIPSNADFGDGFGIDPDIKPYREFETTTTADYALTRDLVLSARLTRKELSRGLEDIGFADAQGNEFFTIGNPGFGLTAQTVPPTPRAIRRYTGLEIRLDKRFSNNWYTNLSYTRSKLYGNYSGLASSDENGRTDPNVSRLFDLPFLSFDSFGNVLNGKLATDRPNTFKAFAAYRFDYGMFGKRMTTEVGGSQVIYQGIPVTTEINATDVPGASGALAYALGRGDAGRTNVFTQTDLILTHFIPVTENVRFRMSLNVLNLFNEKNEEDRNRTLTGPGELITYADLNDYLTSNGDFRDRGTAGACHCEFFENALYNKTNLFQLPIRARFSFGIQF